MLTFVARGILQADFSRRFPQSRCEYPERLASSTVSFANAASAEEGERKRNFDPNIYLEIASPPSLVPRVTAMYIALNERSNIQLTLINGKWCCALSTIRAVAWPPWEAPLHASEDEQMLIIDSLRVIVSLQGNGARECAWQGDSCFAKSYKILQHFHSPRWLL